MYFYVHISTALRCTRACRIQDVSDEEVIDTLLQCVACIPTKTAIYAGLAGFLNTRNKHFGTPIDLDTACIQNSLYSGMYTCTYTCIATLHTHCIYIYIYIYKYSGTKLLQQCEDKIVYNVDLLARLYPPSNFASLQRAKQMMRIPSSSVYQLQVRAYICVDGHFLAVFVCAILVASYVYHGF